MGVGAGIGLVPLLWHGEKFPCPGQITERLWRSLKYEAVYLQELSDGFVAQRVIHGWIGFKNTERPHSALDGKTPAEAYWANRPVDVMIIQKTLRPHIPPIGRTCAQFKHRNAEI